MNAKELLPMIEKGISQRYLNSNTLINYYDTMLWVLNTVYNYSGIIMTKEQVEDLMKKHWCNPIYARTRPVHRKVETED